MQDKVTPIDEVADEACVPDVTEPQVHGITNVSRRLVQPAMAALAGVEAECADLRAIAHETFDKVAPDEAVGACDENPTPFQLRSAHDSPPRGALPEPFNLRA